MTDLLTRAAKASSAIELDPLLDADGAEAINAAVLSGGPYGLYAAERSEGPLESKVTGIAYFGHARGGVLRHFPDGPPSAGQRFEPSDNTALVLDTDSRYHRVERVGAPEEPAPVEIVTGATLRHGGTHWVMSGPDGQELRTYGTDESPHLPDIVDLLIDSYQCFPTLS